MEDTYKKLLDQYPFISFITYGGNDYIGIIQNSDEIITTIYDFAALKTIDQKTRFLEMADQWWWESNRLVPINVFLKSDWSEFRSCLKTFNSKDVNIEHGPYISLKEIASKRSKRRSITLVRKVS
jgi:hypothetical protein|tara:strand:+ start:765 stop:1139 length:375 start_codon:yes stop_codon:yes gene_type:complete